MKLHRLPLVFLIFLSMNVQAQTNKPSIEFTDAIEDNSMLIEEAYNQEDGVVQHISNFVLMPDLKQNYAYYFTQEWPAFGLKHQLSYTLQYNWLDKNSVNGFGDLLLNYRYQLWYKNEPVAFSPRFSLILPTGNENKNLGNGSWGIQINLPFSKRWTNSFINHFNAGTTTLLRVKDPQVRFDGPLTSYFAGLSSIWLVTPKLNLMLEIVSNWTAGPEAENKVIYTNDAVFAPAVRGAIDIGGLQIVPGISIPVTIHADSKMETGAFLYLSFEHKYKQN